MLLYELACGYRPWTGEGAIAIAVAQATEQPRPLVANVPQRFATIVAECLVLDRERRTVTAQQIGAAISAINATAWKPPTALTVDSPRAAPVEHRSALVVLPFASAPADGYIADGVRQDLSVSSTVSVWFGARCSWTSKITHGS